MSLLAGIKFIPYSERMKLSETEEKDKEKEKEKKHKSSKKHKHSKEHKKQSHKRKYNEESHHMNSNSDTQSEEDHNQEDTNEDSSDFDMEEYVKQEKEKEKYNDNSNTNIYSKSDSRMEWMSSHNTKESFMNSSIKTKHNTFPNPSNESITSNKFKNLLSSLHEDSSPLHEDSSPSFDSIPKPIISLSSTSTSTSTSMNPSLDENQSVAALLRSKLKSRKGPLQLSDVIIEESHPNKLAKNYLINHPRISNNNTTATTHNLMNASLKRLVAAERSGEEDMDKNLRNNILRLGDRFTTKMMTTSGGGNSRSGRDEDEDGNDINMKMYESKNNTITNNSDSINMEQINKRQIMNAIKHDDKLRSIMRTCPCCIESSQYNEKSYYTIAYGQYTYLRLKIGGFRLHSYHTEIIPFHHIPSIRQCEEEVLLEIQRFQSCLRRLAEDTKLHMIFMESATNFHKYPHCCMDCIPVENERDVIACFKESMLSSGEEWSQHHKWIELKPDRRLHRAIPFHFEYIAVEYGNDDVSSNRDDTNHSQNNQSSKGVTGSYSGLVHVIDNTGTDMNRNFCLDVIAGIFDEDPMRIRSKMPTDFGKEKKNIEEFKKLWEYYDWTKYITMNTTHQVEEN